MPSWGAFLLVLGGVEIISTTIIILLVMTTQGINGAIALQAYKIGLIYLLLGGALYYTRARELNFRLKDITLESLHHTAPSLPFLMFFIGAMSLAGMGGVGLKLIIELSLYFLIYWAHRKGMI